MSQIIFNITIVAKDVKHALKLKAEFIEAGEGVAISVTPSNTPRSLSAPSPIGQGGNGKHVAKLCEYLGINQFRCSEQMAMQFGLVGDREQRAEKFLSLLTSGQVVKTISGYALASGGGVSQDGGEGEEGIDLDNVV